MLGGVATGKSYTGSQFAILNMVMHPDKTGLIGANTHDQLTQATLREMFYWLDAYNIDYVVDRIPPAEWGVGRKFKTYRNVLSVKVDTGKVAHAFIRILSDPDSLRGIEISWYWIDETRDTEQYAHDMILGRMRESDYVRGLITSTTNGEDWVFHRFVRGGSIGDGLYGSCHVPTIESVKAKIITQEYYDTMRRTYSPLMALQELDAQHVNVRGGRAYYSESEKNRMSHAPWGDYHPNPDRPLIVGCDFNFQPAPIVWMVGQIGTGQWDDHIHWFGELSGVETSSRVMGQKLVNNYPGFFYRIFGDASGTRGTTSNAGQTDFNQIADELESRGASFTIDVDPGNPLVKDRVENVNARLCNSMGEVRMTYDPDRCPFLAGDFKVVGWRKLVARSTAQGKLDDMGDPQRTHAADAAGYALYKLFPPGRRLQLIDPIISPVRSGVGLSMERPALTW